MRDDVVVQLKKSNLNFLELDFYAIRTSVARASMASIAMFPTVFKFMGSATDFFAQWKFSRDNFEICCPITAIQFWVLVIEIPI